MDRLTALLDANVLYPAGLRDLLLRLADRYLFAPLWSRDIHSEWTGNLLADRPDIDPAILDRTRAIMAATGKSKTCVWHWRERFMEEGVDGLLRDKTRPPGRKPLAPERIAAIVRLTQTPPAGEATHWTLRAMAKAAGVAASTVRTIWQAHGLTPNRWRQI